MFSPRPTRLRLVEDDVAPVLVFIALAAIAFLTPAQNDTWWHLRSGKEIWESQRFVDIERFSHTAYGAPVLIHWWLSQLMFYGAYIMGGPPVLAAFAGAIAWLAVFGSWRLFQGTFEVRLVLLMFLVPATNLEWAVRPQVFSLALLVLMAHLVVRDRLVWLPIVCLVWVNVHAMVIFGVVMAGACAIEALIWTRHRLKQDLLVMFACVLAPMVSPLGWQYWQRTFRTIFVSKVLKIQEYQVPLELIDAPFWLAVVALVVVVLRQWPVLHERPREDRILLIAAAVLAIAAATAVRNIAFFAVVAAPVLSRMWSTAPQVTRADRPAGRGAYVLCAAACAIGVLVVGLRWQDGGKGMGWAPMSPGVVGAVRACRAPLFNHFEDGGYLTWTVPEQPVFVDSRVDVYPLEFLMRIRAADLEGEYRELFDDYGVNCALVRTNSTIAARLAQDDAMHVVYRDDSRTVFERTIE